MVASNVISAIKSGRLKAAIRDGILRVGPREAITPDLRAALAEGSTEVTAWLASNGDEDLAWRVAAMLQQLRDVRAPGPLPTLFAKSYAKPKPEDCKSCGETLDTRN